MNYEIFLTLQKRYVIDEGQEALKYPEHLRLYVEKHNIAEFVEIKGSLKATLEKSTDASQVITLKIDIKETCKLARLTDLKIEIAKILDVTPLGVQLLDVEKGCVVVTFLVVNSIVDAIFTGEKEGIFTEGQVKMFRAFSVKWLKCKDYKWNFMEPLSNTSGTILLVLYDNPLPFTNIYVVARAQNLPPPTYIHYTSKGMGYMVTPTPPQLVPPTPPQLIPSCTTDSTPD